MDSERWEDLLEKAESAKEDYQRDGVVVLRDVFSQEWLDKIAQGIEKVKASPSKYHSEIQEGGEKDGKYFMDYCNWERIPEIKETAFSSPVARLAQILMGSESVVFYHEHVLTKEKGTSKATPWHHDQPYYPCDGDLNCTIWIPVDPVPIESSVRFAKGSHRWGKWFYPRHFRTFEDYPVKDTDTGEQRQRAPTYTDENGRLYESIPSDLDSNPDYEISSYSFSPGDCVVFHMKTVHAAAPNYNDEQRRVISFRMIAEDAVFVKRPWDESPPLEAHPGLEFGQRLMGDHFPQIPIKTTS